jgi:hypothetical protein
VTHGHKAVNLFVRALAEILVQNPHLIQRNACPLSAREGAVAFYKSSCAADVGDYVYYRIDIHGNFPN